MQQLQPHQVALGFTSTGTLNNNSNNNTFHSNLQHTTSVQPSLRNAFNDLVYLNSDNNVNCSVNESMMMMASSGVALDHAAPPKFSWYMGGMTPASLAAVVASSSSPSSSSSMSSSSSSSSSPSASLAPKLSY